MFSSDLSRIARNSSPPPIATEKDFSKNVRGNLKNSSKGGKSSGKSEAPTRLFSFVATWNSNDTGLLLERRQHHLGEALVAEEVP